MSRSKRIRRFLRSLLLCCVKTPTTNDLQEPELTGHDHSSLANSTEPHSLPTVDMESFSSTYAGLNQSSAIRSPSWRMRSNHETSVVQDQTMVLKVYQLDPHHLAEELTLQDAQMFRRINVSELRNGAWTTKDKVIHLFNLVKSQSILYKYLCFHYSTLHHLMYFL